MNDLVKRLEAQIDEKYSIRGSLTGELLRESVIRIHELEKELAQWKSNHSNLVDRCRLLRDRLDLPAEQVHPRLRILDELDSLRKKFNETTGI